MPDDLPVRLSRRVNPFPYRPRYRQSVAMDQATPIELLEHRLDAAHAVEIGDKHLAGGIELADLGGSFADIVNLLQGQGAAAA